MKIYLEFYEVLSIMRRSNGSGQAALYISTKHRNVALTGATGDVRLPAVPEVASVRPRRSRPAPLAVTRAAGRPALVSVGFLAQWIAQESFATPPSVEPGLAAAYAPAPPAAFEGLNYTAIA